MGDSDLELSRDATSNEITATRSIAFFILPMLVIVGALIASAAAGRTLATRSPHGCIYLPDSG